MGEEFWQDINESLTRFDDVQQNWLTRVAEELSTIERAASAVSDNIPGHALRVEAEYPDVTPKTWNRILVVMVRERDQYEFQHLLEINLDHLGCLAWRELWEKEDRIWRSFLTKRKDNDWFATMARMVDGNLRCLRL